MIKSVNNKIICKPYKKEAKLKSKTDAKGFSYISQKTEYTGLEVLVTFYHKEVTLHPGDIVFVKEETAHSNPEFTKTSSCNAIEERFISVDFGYVEFVSSK